MIGDISYTLRMRWREKTVEVRGAPKVFSHVAVQWDVIDTRMGRPRRTKVLDKFVESPVAAALAATIRAGATAAQIPLQEMGDYFDLYKSGA